MNIIDRLKGIGKASGGISLNDQEPAGIIDTVAFFDDDGICIGRNGSVTIYRIIENTPVKYESVNDRMSVGYRLDELLVRLQKTTSTFEGFMEEQSRMDRTVHFVTLQWAGEPTVRSKPGKFSPELDEHIAKTLKMSGAFEQRVLIGVELFKSPKTISETWAAFRESSSEGSSYQTLITPYLGDLETVTDTLNSWGTRKLTRTERNRFIGWHNHGENVDVPINWGEKYSKVSSNKGDYRMKMYAIEGIDRPLPIPGNELILNSMNITEDEFPSICFIRTQLESSRYTTKRAKKTIKNEMNQMSKDQEDGDLPDEEIIEKYEGAYQLRSVLTGDERPTLKETSIVYGTLEKGGYAKSGTEFIDNMSTRFDARVSPLAGQQLEGFASTRPGGALEINPIPNMAIKTFLNKYAKSDYSSALIAFSGATTNGDIGDHDGFLIGRNLPNYEPHYFDPFRTSDEGVSPAWLILGEPGSGKSHLMKDIILQAHLNKTGGVFIHPKPDHSLKPFCAKFGMRFLNFKPSDKESAGMLDPFLYISDRRLAGKLAADYLLSTVLHGLDGIDQNRIHTAFLKAADDPTVTCGAQALRFLPDLSNYPREKLITMIADSIKYGGPAAIMLSTKASDGLEFASANKTMTIVHIEEDFGLDGDGAASRTNRALLKLLVLESLYSLTEVGEGLFMVDEAHAFLGDSEISTQLSNVVRKGRSLRIMPIFASQRVTDLSKSGFQPSRITMLRTTTKEEAIAGLKLARMPEPYDEHIRFLKDCNYQREIVDSDGKITKQEKLPQGLMMDLNQRHGRISLGPHLPEMLAAYNDKPAK